MNSVDFLVINNWGSGFTANLSLTNSSSNPLEGWVLEFDAPFEITNIWNAEIVSREGDRYVIRNLSWNGNLATNQTVSFGFNGNSLGSSSLEPSNYLLNSQPIDSLGGGDPSPDPDPITPDPINPDPVDPDPVDPDPVDPDPVDETPPVSETPPSEPTPEPELPGSDTPTDPIEGDNQTAVDFTVKSDWGSGFTASIALGNESTTALEGWTLEFNAPFEITNIWNAEIVSREGDRYVIRNLSWNGAVAPNGTVEIGFNGNKSSGTVLEPSNFVLNGKPLSSGGGFPDPDPTPEPTPEPTPAPTPEPVPLPTLSIGDVAVLEGDSGTSLANFEVELSKASDKPVTVQFTTANGSAIAGSDYTATVGTLTFNPGETLQTIQIPVMGDIQVEGNETFKVNFSNPTQAAIAQGSGTATIINDDEPTPSPEPEPEPELPETPSSGQFNYGEALQKSFLFYEAQRSGPLPDDNRIAWRGDSGLNDGADVGRDLTGGYYDAGDGVKFGFPMAGSMTMLSWGVVEYGAAYQQSGQLDEALDAIKWGTDYILKAHETDSNGTKAFWGQVGRGDLDHAYWGPPEDMKMARPSFKIDRQNPGSDLAGESAAALAAASIAFRGTDSAYANKLLQNAKQLFEFADTYRGKYSDSIPDAANYYNSWSGYNDELVWAATWLHKAVEASGGSDTAYLQKAESYYQGINSSWTHNWDDKSHGAAVLLAQETNQSRYRSDVEGWLNNWTNGSGGVAQTDGGLAWLSQWGSLRYSANTAFLAAVYSDTVNDYGDRYENFAEQQIDYILGDNPRNSSYMVGFGDNSPKSPHHRGSHGGTWSTFNSSAPNDNLLYGALVGGPASTNDFDYKDDRTDYIRNEVALDYNAGLTGALAWMYDNFGGQPLNNSQLDALSGIELTGANSAF